MTFFSYVAVQFPLRPRVEKRTVCLSLALVWFLASALSIPPLIYSTTIEVPFFNGEKRTFCFMSWPDGRRPNSTMEFTYNLAFLAFTYLIPGALMGFCYGKMGRTLWSSEGVGEMTERQRLSIRSKKKVVKMFMVIVLAFAVCWFPYHVYFLYTDIYPKSAKGKTALEVFLTFYWLAMCNGMLNPIIYFAMSARFRGYLRSYWTNFRQLFSKCRNCKSSSGRTASNFIPMLQLRSDPDPLAPPPAQFVPPAADRVVVVYPSTTGTRRNPYTGKSTSRSPSSKSSSKPKGVNN